MSGLEEDFFLDENEIHIWNYTLKPDKKLAEFYFDNLTEEEKDKAEKIIIKEVKYRNILSRVITKKILANYLDKKLNRIHYCYNRFGKPGLSSEINPMNLNFNISHSGDLGIIAISKNNPVGIDIEQILELNDLDNLMDLIFTESEIKQIDLLDHFDKTKMFYKIWTAKEAFVKAIGQGLSFPVKNIELEINHLENISIKYIKKFPDSLNDWQLLSFVPEENYISTLAVNINNVKTKNFKWS